MSGIIGGIKGSMKKKFVPVTAGDANWISVSMLLPFNGTNGSSTFTDTVTPSRSFSNSGSPQISTSVKQFGTGSISFNGSSYITTPVTNDFVFGTGDFTVEFWAKNNSWRTTQNMYYNGMVHLGHYSIGVVATVIYNGNLSVGIGGVGLECAFSPNTSQWYHIAITRASGTAYVFINGVLSASGANTTNVSPTGTAYIGTSAHLPNNEFMDGNIDDLRVTKGVARYTANFTPPTSALPTSAVPIPSILRWDDNWANVSLLLNGDGAAGSTTFTDLSSSPKTLTPYGNAQISTSQIKYGTGAMYFDGAGDYLTMPSTTDLVFQSDFTIECWVYRVTASANYDALYTTNATQSWDVNGNSSAFVWSAGGFHGFGLPWTTYSSGTSVPTGIWTHMAVSKFNGTVKFFMNGTQIHTLAHSGDIGVASQTQGIGVFDSYTGSPRLFFNGYIDEFRITKGVARYTAAFTPPQYALPSASGTSIDPNYNNVSLLLRGNDTNGSTTFVDSSSSPKSLTTYGNTQTSTSVKKFGTGSIYFDGSGDYLRSPDNSAFAFGSSDFTVEYWIYYTSSSTTYGHCVLDTRVSNGNATGIAFSTMNNGAAEVYTNTEKANAGTAPSNTWNHYAFVRSSGTLTGYINGTSVFSIAFTQNLTDTSCFIGTNNPQNTWTTGYIDDLRVTKGVARYTANFTPPTYESPNATGTTLDPNFSQVSLFIPGSDLLDHSISPKTLSVTGNTSVSTSIKKYGTGSLYFDGSGDYITAPWSVMPTGTNNFTIEFWKYTSNSRAAGGIFGYRASASDNFQIYEGWPAAGEYLLLNDSTIQVGINRSVPLNTWEHFAWVRNGNSFMYFINGVLQTTVTSSADVTKSYSNCYLGDKLFSGGYDFNGYINDLRVTHGVARYTTNFTPPTASLPTTGGSSTLGSISNPATDIAALRSAGNTTDGMYYFKNATSGATTFQAYCKFNYIDGGDWYLLLKVHNQGDMPSGSAYWTNTTLYNETDSNLTSGTWAKYATWNYVPFNRVMMQMTQGGTTKIPPIMIFNTSRTFAQAITAAGTPSTSSGLLCDSTDPALPNGARYWEMTMKSGTNFTDANGAEDYMQGYGISSWGNNSTNSTTAEGFSSLGRAGAWIGCPLDEGTHTFNSASNSGADSGFGFGGACGNPAKTFSAGYAEWTNSASTNTLPGYVWVR
jgi:hypothetical protein